MAKLSLKLADIMSLLDSKESVSLPRFQKPLSKHNKFYYVNLYLDFYEQNVSGLMHFMKRIDKVFILSQC